MRSPILVLLTFAAGAVGIILPPPPSTCAGAVNLRAITPGGAAPVLNTTATGSSKRVVTEGLSAPLIVLHVYGSVYDMHKAAGELLRQEIAALVPATLQYLYAAVNASYNLTWLPEPVQDWMKMRP